MLSFTPITFILSGDDFTYATPTDDTNEETEELTGINKAFCQFCETKRNSKKT